ncbi:MAG: hypothetical protein AB7O52_14215 [Planctomycetota bacterium]
MLWALLLILVIVGALVWIFVPLFGRKDPWSHGANPAAIRLLQDKKEQVLRLIKDLEQELEARAIDPVEYAELREKYLTEAAVLSRRLLALQGTRGHPAVSAPPLPPSDRSGGTGVADGAETAEASTKPGSEPLSGTGTWLGAGLLALFLLLAGSVEAVELRPFRLDSRLVDGTAARQRDPVGAATTSAAPTYLASLSVRVFTIRADGTEEEIDASTDENGRLAIDLGERPLGASVKLVAKSGNQGYLALPLDVGTPPPATISMFQITTEPAGLEQGVMRIVTAQVADSAGGGASAEVVHVRQILSVGDKGHRVYLGSGDAVVTVVFPVPAGADLVSLEINGRAPPRLDLVDVSGWGRGWGYTGPVYPETRMIGTYTMAVAPGEEVDLGLGAPIPTASMVLAVESGRFQFLPESSDRDPPLVSGGKPISLPRVKQVCEPWQAMGLPAGRSVRYSMRFLPPGAPAPAGAGSPHAAHPGAHGAEDTGPPAGQPVPFLLHATLYDGTLYYRTSSSSPHGGGASGGEVRPLAGARVEVETVTGDGTRERFETSADEHGTIRLDLGTRPARSPVSVVASVGSTEYQLFPVLRVGVRYAPQQLCFQRTRATEPWVQDVFRVVTEQVGVAGAEPFVHVRQIQRLRNPAYEVIPATPAGQIAPLFFPMPAGAELLSLEVDGEAIASPAPQADSRWGHGVPLSVVIGPEAAVMGTYRLPLTNGPLTDLGLVAPVHTESLVLALEEARFQYEEDPTGVRFRDGGVAQAPGVSKSCRQWLLRGLEPATKVAAMVRYGRPPVKLRTILITLLIVALGGGGLVLGRTLSVKTRAAEEMAAERVLAELEAVELRFAQGELTRAEFEAEQARLATAVARSRPDRQIPLLDDGTRQELTAAARRSDRSPAQAEADLRLLADAVQRYLLGGSDDGGGRR